MRALLVIVIVIATSTSVRAQNILAATITDGRIVSLNTASEGEFVTNVPVVSFQVRNKSATMPSSTLKVESRKDTTQSAAYQILVQFFNPTRDTLYLSNVVPFGESKDRVYITGLGNHSLSRTHLFL